MSLVRDELTRLSPYVCARDLYKGADVLLDANESPYPCSDACVDAGLPLNRYPDSDSTELIAQLAAYAGVGPDQVLAGNGSDEIISLTLSAIAQRGDNVVTVQPGYSMYGVCARILGVEERVALLGAGFRFDADAVLAQVDARTRGIFFPSPNSVVGTAAGSDAIQRLLESFDGVVFLDEAYVEFGGTSAVALLGEFENLVISRTLSKAWGLAGLRVGYALANPSFIRALRKLKPPYNVGSVNQYLAVRALREGRATMERNVASIRSERERLGAQLARRGMNVFDSVANFVLVRVPFGLDSLKIQRQLAQKGVIVRDRSTLPLLGNCLRITIGTPQEDNRLLQALDSILEVRAP